MEAKHDVHDWLGGYPYESILPDDVETLMKELGFHHKLSLLRVPLPQATSRPGRLRVRRIFVRKSLRTLL